MEGPKPGGVRPRCVYVPVAPSRAIDPGEEIARTGEVTAQLSLKHDVVISRVFISADQFSEEQSPLLLNVRREGIQICPASKQRC